MELRSRRQIFIAIFVLLITLVPIASVQAEDPWQFLKGFDLIPDSRARIEEHYVAALFVNREKQQLAVVVFNANCDSGNCELHRRAAYSVFDAQGVNVQRYIDPSDQELLRLISDRLAAGNRKEGT
jgi:hypothetical protein